MISSAPEKLGSLLNDLHVRLVQQCFSLHGRRIGIPPNPPDHANRSRRHLTRTLVRVAADLNY